MLGLLRGGKKLARMGKGCPMNVGKALEWVSGRLGVGEGVRASQGRTN